MLNMRGHSKQQIFTFICMISYWNILSILQVTCIVSSAVESMNLIKLVRENSNNSHFVEVVGVKHNDIRSIEISYDG